MARITVSCLVCLLNTPGLVYAQPSPEQQQREQAQTIFFAAEEAYAKGNYEEALLGYEQAYLLTQEPLLLFNQAQCYRQLRRYQEALDTYQLFLAKMPDERTYAPKAKEWIQTIQTETGLTPTQKTQPTATRPSTQETIKEPPKGIEPKETPSISRKLLYVSIGAGALWAGFGLGALGVARGAHNAQTKPTDLANAPKISEDLLQRQERAHTLGTVSDIALVGTVAATAGYIYLHTKEEKKLSAAITPRSISLSVRF